MTKHSPVVRLFSVWILLGIVLPLLLHLTLRTLHHSKRGVIFTHQGRERTADSFITALSEIRQRQPRGRVEIRSYVWNPMEGDVLFVLKGIGACELSSNGTTILTKKGTAYAASYSQLPGGFSELRLIYRFEESKRPFEFVWSHDSITAEPISARHTYLEPDNRAFYLDQIERYSLIITRLNLVLIIFAATTFFIFGKKIKAFGDEHPRSIPLFVILAALFLWLRMSGIDYVLHDGLHPDERLIGGMIDDLHEGRVHPEQFWYTPGYVNISVLAEKLATWVIGEAPPRNLAPRVVSAFFSWLSCFLVYSIARFHFAHRVSLVAMIFFGFAFMPVQISRFAIIEPTMVFFFLLAFRLILPLHNSTFYRSFILAGFFAGTAVATKQTAAVIFVPAIATFVLLLGNQPNKKAAFLQIAIFGIAAFTGFFLLAPQTILHFDEFYRYQLSLRKSMGGELGNSLFYASTQSRFRGFFLLMPSIVEGLGILVFAAALAGMILIWRQTKIAGWQFVPFALIYLFIISISPTPVYHYGLLICPFLAILAAVTLNSKPLKHRTFVILVLLLLSPSLVRITALQRVLHGVDTRIAAQQWAYQNLPAGARIDHELFGPRFFVPMFDTHRLKIFKRRPWDEHFRNRRPQHYVYDSLTAKVFRDGGPHNFPVEAVWLNFMEEKAKLRKTFRGSQLGSSGLYNPEIRIYEIPAQEQD